MAQRVLFISESQVKSLSLIDDNVDSKLLSKTIELVQENYLKGVLGKSLYDTLISEVYEFKTNETEIPALHNLLLNEYIKPYLIHQTVIEFITTSSYRISNKGVIKLNDDAADNLSESELSSLKSLFNNYATQYKAELIEFLKTNNLINHGENTDTDLVSAGGGGWFLKSRLN